MTTRNEEDISKFLSYVLRHKPESIELQLDNEGWGNIEALIRGAAKKGRLIDPALIQLVVKNSDKKRFAISEDGQYIRAVQGHSTTSVEIDYPQKVPPESLYHGTATRFLNAIKKEGLNKGARQYVHLSHDQQVAFAVGQRYGKAIILTINALQMHQKGFTFYQASNGVWLTLFVAPEFIIF